jgi:hypothetical protein
VALMMEAACNSETSVDIQLRTRQYIPEDSELQLRILYEAIDAFTYRERSNGNPTEIQTEQLLITSQELYFNTNLQGRHVANG